MVDAATLVFGNPDNLQSDEKDTIDAVLAYYGEMEPYELREQTHSESPWIDARGNYHPSANCSTVITKAGMGIYYGSL